MTANPYTNLLKCLREVPGHKLTAGCLVQIVTGDVCALGACLTEKEKCNQMSAFGYMPGNELYPVIMERINAGVQPDFKLTYQVIIDRNDSFAGTKEERWSYMVEWAERAEKLFNDMVSVTTESIAMIPSTADMMMNWKDNDNAKDC